MKIIKGLSGFGDAIYLRVATEWLLKNNPDDYVVLNDFPDVFQGLKVKIEKYNRNAVVDYEFSYLKHKNNPNTTQFQDMVINANLPPIEFTSQLKNRQQSNQIIAIPLYSAFGQLRVMNNILVPKKIEFDKLVNSYDNVKYLEQKKYPFMELIKIFNTVKLVICQVGWGIPLAEMLDTPLLVCFNQASLQNGRPFIRTITPQKVLEKKEKNTKFVILKSKEIR